MKKLLLFSVCAFLTTAPLTAQITLDSNTYIWSVPSRDTFKGDPNKADFPNLAPALNGNWTLSSLNYESTIFSRARLSSPPHSFIDSTTAKFNHSPHPPAAAIAEIPYVTQYYTNLSSAAEVETGEDFPPQKYSIASITTGINDSIFFSPQNINYNSGSRTVLAWPATLGAGWSSAYNRSVNFNLSIAAYALSNVPCVRKSHIEEIDSVVGWGKMRVKTLAATLSGYMNVLQVKAWVISSDTFYVNGNPAPDSVLAPFNLKQATPDTVQKMYFYRLGELSPLLEIDCYGNFDTVTYGKVHVQRLAPATNVSQVNNGDAITIYPNPVLNRKVSLDILAASSGKWSYDVINVTGQKVASASLALANGQNHVDINLPVLNTGIYYIIVRNNNKQVLVKALDIAE